MSDSEYDVVSRIFLAARDIPAAARDEFLAKACAESPQLREQVEELLRHDGAASEVFGTEVMDDELRALAADEGIKQHPQQIGPYRILDVLGEGGMGTVYRAEQTEPLRREVALKLIKLGMDTREVLARFEAERQALTLLDHPNVARILDAGCSSEGRPFFAMEHVPGLALNEFCDRHRFGVEARLELFVQICRGVQHAHFKGIVHRDLKPSNVLVQMQDERPVPRIIDFGLAKAMDQRLTERTFFTAQGQFLGTPEYMSPEQADPIGSQVDSRTDVYSLGVMLYELLAGALPFDAHELRRAALTEIQRRICEDDPPTPSKRVSTHAGSTSTTHARNRRCDDPGRLQRRLRGDLDWITMKALAKDPADRYQTAAELAAEIQRHLRHEPVDAGPPSNLYRLAKLARRHRRAVLAGAAVMLALIVGLVASLIQYSKAEANAQAAEKNLSQFLRMRDVALLADLEAQTRSLWPPGPSTAPEMADWLERAEGLLARLPQHRAVLAELRARALPYEDETRREDVARNILGGELESLLTARETLREHVEASRAAAQPEDPKLAALEQRLVHNDDLVGELEERVYVRRWSFPDYQDKWLHDTMTKLIEDLERFGEEQTGSIALIREYHAHAETISQRSVEAFEEQWEDAITDIMLSDRYGGLELEPQLGLVPLGPDLDSGLWEFWHVLSGERPQRDAETGRWRMGEETGLVLVLIPGGTFWMGAQSQNPQAPNYDPLAKADEAVHTITLDAFFLSKYEMTQAQWLRTAKANPSQYGPGVVAGGHETTLCHPAELMAWNECTPILPRLDLVLPTEAQWEYAARAGTDTPWWTGDSVQSLQGAANLSDAYSRVNGGHWSWQYEDSLNDGYMAHAPVGTYRPNPFGLYDMAGNVWEWCRDWYVRYDWPVRERDGFRLAPASTERVTRGGGWVDGIEQLRSAWRGTFWPSYSSHNTGLRPFRPVRTEDESKR